MSGPNENAREPLINGFCVPLLRALTLCTSGRRLFRKYGPPNRAVHGIVNQIAFVNVSNVDSHRNVH